MIFSRHHLCRRHPHRTRARACKILYICVLTATEVYGNGRSIQTVACGRNKSLVSKSLMEERGPAGVIWYFFSLLDGVYPLFKPSLRLWTLNLPKGERLCIALPYYLLGSHQWRVSNYARQLHTYVMKMRPCFCYPSIR